MKNFQKLQEDCNMKTLSQKNKKLHVWYDNEGDFLEFRIGKSVKGENRLW